MRTQKVKQSTHHSDGSITDYGEHEFVFHDIYDEPIDALLKYEERGACVRYGPKLPSNWGSLSKEERLKISTSEKFDLEVKTILMGNGVEASKNDVEIVSLYTELQDLTIWGRELEAADIEKLLAIESLRSLCIPCSQFGDDIVPILIRFNSLQRLDVQGTLITESGLQQLKSKIPNVWG